MKNIRLNKDGTADQITTNDEAIIDWNPSKLAQFKLARRDAFHSNASCTSFTFEGHEYDVKYAKHLIEFLELEFAK